MPVKTSCSVCGQPIPNPGDTVCSACQLQSGLTTAGEFYAAFLARSAGSAGPDFEGLCAALPALAAELRQLHAITRSAKGGASPVHPAGESPAARSLTEPSKPAAPVWPPGSRYRVEGIVARGGMGVIYAVQDRELNRRIAMKVIGAGFNGHAPVPLEELPPAWVDRFVEEAKITAQLDHPGIVPVHEMGLDPQGRLYFTMKLVTGRCLGEIFRLARDRREGWTLTRAIVALLRACEAVAHAHEHGVIHRDLKPGNIMVGRLGQVFVMDWGVARSVGCRDLHELRPATAPQEGEGGEPRRPASAAAHGTADSPLITADGTVLGTPAYMSPEHAQGRVEEVGPGADVYALGAVLYELLAGHPPYLGPGVRLSSKQLLEAVRSGPPKPIAALARDKPAGLVAICAKAIERDPRARYANAGELAEDLQAWLDHRVVRAHRTGALAELKAWILRNRLAAFSQAAGVSVLVTGLVAIIALQTAAVSRIDRGNRDLQDALYAATIIGAANAIEREDHETARQMLDRSDPARRHWEWHRLALSLPDRQPDVVHPGSDPDPTGAASGQGGPFTYPGAESQTGGRSLLDPDSETHVTRIAGPPNRVWTAAFTPDSRYLISAGLDGVLRLSDATTGRLLRTFPGPTNTLVFSVAVTPEGRRAVSAGEDGHLRVWDIETGTQLLVIQAQNHPGREGDLTLCVALDPDGQRMVSGGFDGNVQVWEIATGNRFWAARTHPHPLHTVAWSANGQQIAAGGQSGSLTVRSARDGQELWHMVLPVRSISAVAFHPDPNRPELLTADSSGALRVWNSRDGRLLRSIPAHQRPICSVDYSPDGRRLVSAGLDRRVQLWDARLGEPLLTLPQEPQTIHAVGFSPDGQRLFSANDDGHVRVWQSRPSAGRLP